MGIGAELRRQSGLPLIAGGTDVVAGDVVQLSGPWQVRPVTAKTQQPIGVARASAAKGGAVDIRDRGTGDIVRAVAAATVLFGEEVGFASNGATAGASGNVQVTMLAPVVAGVGGTPGAVVWSVGLAVETAATGNSFAFIVNPRQLSGLS